MNTASVDFRPLSVSDYRTYLLAAVFIAGNIILPQLVHFVPQGGLVFLPIYFFTLVAAYRYGIVAGLLTAILSPLMNHWMFGMPPTEMLPIILTKSVLLAIAAATAAKYFNKVSIFSLFLVVLSYQLLGTMIEWAMVKDFWVAIQDFRMGVPGMLLQVVGGYLLIKMLSK